MQFSTKEDIEAPIEYVFEKLSNFSRFERSVMRRGGEVERLDLLTETAVGMRWRVTFALRGKLRRVLIELVQYSPPTGMEFHADASGMTGKMCIDLVPLSRTRTRVSLVLSLKPQTLPARLLVQSLKLARSNFNRRYRLRVAEFAKDMEDRYQMSL